MELTGTLIQKLALQSGVSKTGNSWQKQEFIVEYKEGKDQYSKKICLTLWGDKIDDLQKINVSDPITVSFSIESREYNGKWYTDVKAWKIEAVAPAHPISHNDTPTDSASNNYSASLPEEDATFVDDSQNDDLPF